MTTYAGKPEAETNNGSTGDDIFENILGADILSGRNGSDTFIFNQAPALGTKIDGGSDNGISDTVVKVGTSTTTGSTLSATVTYAKTDVIRVNNSMDLSGLNFTHIEKIELVDGVNLTMSAEQFLAGLDSLEYAEGSVKLNPGLQVNGTLGGAAEKLTIVVEPGADFQLDDATTGYMFNNVDVTIQFSGGNTRYDGTAADEFIQGGSGTEYITPRLGNDTVYAGAGNDLLIGHEGADKLYGEDGDDIFLISRIATKVGGGTFTIAKASDGTAELVAGDVMDGGAGVDELRITATGTNVSATENTIILTEDNFRNIEKVTIGTAIARDAAYANTQEQMAAGAYTAVTTGKDAINVDGSALQAGVSYQGNDGNNILKGGSGNDKMYGGLGNDILDGGQGTDTLVLNPATLSGLKVLLSKDMHTVLANTTTDEKDVFSNFELAEIGGQSIDIGFLAQPAENLKNLGMLTKLLFNQAPSVDILANFGAQASNAKGIVDLALNLDVVKKMSNAQFASTIVNNGLGSNDAGTIKVVENYLNDHSRAELVLTGMAYDPVISHIFGADGMALL